MSNGMASSCIVEVLRAEALLRAGGHACRRPMSNRRLAWCAFEDVDI